MQHTNAFLNLVNDAKSRIQEMTIQEFVELAKAFDDPDEVIAYPAAFTESVDVLQAFRPDVLVCVSRDDRLARTLASSEAQAIEEAYIFPRRYKDRLIQHLRQRSQGVR